jgi:hypothetical protein
LTTSSCASIAAGGTIARRRYDTMTMLGRFFVASVTILRT